MKVTDILHRCFRCGYCKFPSNYEDFNCPSYVTYRFETFSPGGRMWVIREWLDGRLETSNRFKEILYSCATCSNCVNHCAFPDFRDMLLDVFRYAKEKLIDEGDVPPPVRDYLTNLYKFKNGFGIPQKKRFEWAEEVEDYDSKKHNYLLYVGDEACFDPVANNMARSTVELFKKINVPFGILTTREISDGLEAYNLGETELFKEIAKRLLEIFKEVEAKKIVTISPHSLYVFKKIYPAFFDMDFEFYHYTHVIRENLSRLTNSKIFKKISYHDPCYLGRYLKDYTTVRDILSFFCKDFLELSRNKKNSLCCGGGGGNFYTALTQKNLENSAKKRIVEALELGVDCLIVSCPICLVMLNDAKKTLGLDDKIEVMDVSEFILKYV